MDYEQKYKEALEKARQLCLYPTTRPFINDLQNLFPELRESEDEKVRKGLVKAVSGTFEGNKLFGTDVTREEALAWLEKQGEKKPCDETMAEALRTEYKKGIADAFKRAKEAFCKATCNDNPPRSTCTSLGTCKEYDNFVKFMKV